jgi:hypothetical protein
MIPSDGSALLDGRIFSHKKNFWNNWDKYLVWMWADHQPFMIWEDYNDPDYNLPKLTDSKELMFVVCGNYELGGLFWFFRKKFKK